MKVVMKVLQGNNIRDTSFCEAITIVYDEMELEFFINTIAKPHVKKYHI